VNALLVLSDGWRSVKARPSCGRSAGWRASPIPDDGNAVPGPRSGRWRAISEAETRRAGFLGDEVETARLGVQRLANRPPYRPFDWRVDAVPKVLIRRITRKHLLLRAQTQLAVLLLVQTDEGPSELPDLRLPRDLPASCPACASCRNADFLGAVICTCAHAFPSDSGEAPISSLSFIISFFPFFFPEDSGTFPEISGGDKPPMLL